MKKFLIILLLILPIVLPNYALAAWWNPFTWHFNNWFKSNRPTASITSTIPQNTGDSSSEIEKLKKENEQLKKKITSESSTPRQPKPSATLNNQTQYQAQITPQITPPPIETWAELEAKYFVSADQKGWTAQIITNALGEKRYYKKENGKWVRKNSEAEIQQTYVSPVQPLTYIPSVPPPTSEQLARVKRMCSASVEIQSVCDRPNFMTSYNSNLVFRSSIDELFSKYDWETRKTKGLAEADSEGLNTVTFIDKYSGKKFYYQKENGVWIQKNSEAELHPQSGYTPLPPDIQALQPNPSQIQQFRGFQPPYYPSAPYSPPTYYTPPPIYSPPPMRPYQPPLDTRCEYDPFTHVTNCTTGIHIGL